MRPCAAHLAALTLGVGDQACCLKKFQVWGYGGRLLLCLDRPGWESPSKADAYRAHALLRQGQKKPGFGAFRLSHVASVYLEDAMAPSRDDQGCPLPQACRARASRRRRRYRCSLHGRSECGELGSSDVNRVKLKISCTMRNLHLSEAVTQGVDPCMA